MFLYWTVFFGFNYFGEKLLRNYLQEKVFLSSGGLYTIQFSSMHLNILTGKISLKDFELTPDTLLYQQRKSMGEIKSGLYRISFPSLNIDRLHLFLALQKRRLIARELKIVNPEIYILGHPDTTSIKKNRFHLIYEDIYPLVSQVFVDFHIDSVRVEHGFMSAEGSGKKRQISRGEYEFSAYLRDVSINRYSYYNKDRVFYSTDLDLVIHHFDYSLADSLYFIHAEEVGLSLKRSLLYGKNLSLKPNFKKKHLHQVHPGDFFQLALPSFSIQGINLYEALTGQVVSLDEVTLENFSLKVFRNLATGHASPGGQKNKRKFKVADLFTIISGELKSVEIRSLVLKKASFDYFKSLASANPEMKIAEVNLYLNDFFLDSTAYLNKGRIFYSKDIDLEMNHFNLLLRDEIHTINAGRIRFSTARERIEVQDAIIFPDQIKNLQMGKARKNTLSFFLPSMVFSKIDLKKVFNYRILDFDLLEITEPDLKFIQYHKTKNQDPRFSKPEDLFDEENDDVLYALIKKYLRLIRGHEIRIDRGYFEIDHHLDGLNHKLLSAAFDLQMLVLQIDSAHGMNKQGYFYSRDFNLDVRSLSYRSPDSLNHFRSERLHIVTRDSLIEAWELHYMKTPKPFSGELQVETKPMLSIDFSLKKLYLTGLDHKKMFFEKTLKARDILFDSPGLILKTEKSVSDYPPVVGPVFKKQSDEIHRFEIASLKVRKGAFSYDGYEDRKSSYFSLKDIDFSVLGARVQIPSTKGGDGLIRFDSLQLSVFPFHAVVADSAYALECASLKVHSYPVSITAEGLKLIPLEAFDPSSPQNMKFTANIPRLNLSGFYFDKAIFDKEWIVGKIEAIEPSVFVEMKAVKKSSGGIHLPLLMKNLKISSVLLSNADIGLRVHRSDTVSVYRLKEAFVRISDFIVDSTSRDNLPQPPLFNAGDITVSAKGFSWLSPDSLYEFSFNRFQLSTRDKSARIDSLLLVPRYSRQEFSKKTGHQTDRMEISIPEINIERIDFHRFFNDSVISAGLIRVPGFSFSAYRDKREVFPAWQRPPMPVAALRRIRFPVFIDTLRATNGFAQYEEQTGDEPGRIFFDSLAFTLNHVTNRPGKHQTLEVQSVSRLMGKGKVEARFHFQLENPRDSFTFQARMGRLDLREINPMLSKLMPVSIVSGTADSTAIEFFRGNDSLSKGKLNLWYSHLSLRLEPTREDFLYIIQNMLESYVINWIIPGRNPNDEGKFRQGIICYDRDKSKGFFNFIWKSTLSGIKSTAGFETKTQKEIRRLEKKRKKG